MAAQKTSEFRENTQTRKGRFKRFCILAGVLALSNFGGCKKTEPIQDKEPTPIMRCYDYKDKKLRVYTENKVKKSGENGEENALNFSQLAIKDEKGNSKPLAYFCTHSGHLFWLTPESIFIRKITFRKGGLSVARVLEAKHIEPDEYAVQGTKVVSGSISQDPSLPPEKVIIATLTNTGLFQASRYSLASIMEERLDRAIFNLRYDNDIGVEDRWPEKGVVAGIVHVLDGLRFSVIPLGEMQKGEVKNFYFLECEGKNLRSKKWVIATLQPWKRNPGLKNIFEINKPVRYEKSKGGWVVNLLGERKDGKPIYLFPILTPADEKEK